MRDWEVMAAGEILKQWDRIEGEAMEAGQAAQDPAAEEQVFLDQIAKIIRETYDKCPQCGGTGKSWYAFRGFDSCDRCRGAGKKR